MLMLPRVYRGRLRNTVLCLAFLLGTAFFAFGAVVTTDSVAGRVAFAAVAALMFYISVRTAVMRAVVTPEGIRPHGPLITQSVSWAETTQITSGDIETDFHVFTVRAPVLVVAREGRRTVRIKLTMVSSYTLVGSSADDTHADRIARELESIRLAYTR